MGDKGRDGKRGRGKTGEGRERKFRWKMGGDWRALDRVGTGPPLPSFIFILILFYQTLI